MTKKKKNWKKIGKRSRRKGQVWERKVAKLFEENLNDVTAERTLEQTRDGQKESDVPVRYRGEKRMGLECKHTKAPYNPVRALRQVEVQPGVVPAGVCKTNNDQPTITLELADFWPMARAWLHYGDPNEPEDPEKFTIR